MAKPKVTVLMPVYNGEKYLWEAIDSILNQTFKDFEFLIINDGSTDSSISIIKSYNDPRIRLIHNKKNIGLIKSLNKGIDLARGQYIARMDADDISLPKRLEEQINFMDKNPEIGIVSSWIKVIRKPRSTIVRHPSCPKEIKTNLFFYNPMAHPSVIMRKNLIKKYSLYYDPNFQCAEDRELWTRAAGYFPMANIKKVLLLYRVHKKNVSEIHEDIRKKSIENVRINQLKNLNIIPTKEEMSIHQLMDKPKYYRRKDFINKAEAWLNKLRKQNEKIKFYQESSFSKLISLRWLTLCYVNTEGFWTWKKFWRSSLSRGIKVSQWREISKLFIKCLLKKFKLFKLIKSIIAK